MPNLNKAYQWAIARCNNPKVGYSMAYREQETVNGITYYDCSSFIWYSLIAGGWDVVSMTGQTYPFRTASMTTLLPRLGFSQVDINGEWLPGDIVLRKAGEVPGASVGHTEMVYTGGSASGVTMGAHNGSKPLAEQVSINTYTSYPYPVYNDYRAWKTLWRYGSGGASGTGYNISMYVLSAIAGNWWQESHINPGLFQNLNVVDLLTSTTPGGYGLGQWTYNSADSDRRTPLAEWLYENGYEFDSPDGQIQFFIHENFWISSGWASDFSSLSEFLASDSTDLEYLTKAFYRGWEGGLSETSASERYEKAQAVYSYLSVNAGQSTTWIIGNFYLTTDQILNNCLALYNSFQAYSGDSTVRQRKMPIWMYMRPSWLF